MFITGSRWSPIKMFLFITATYLLLVRTTIGVSLLKIGPYNMEVKRFETCSNTGTNEMKMDLHMKKTDARTVYIYGNFSFKKPITHDTQFKLTTSTWGNGGWRENYYTFNIGKNSCEKLFDYQTDFMTAFWAFENYNVTDHCNIPAGFYRLKGFKGNEIVIGKLPVMFYGLYRNDFMICSETGKILGCLRSVFAVTEKFQPS